MYLKAKINSYIFLFLGAEYVVTVTYTGYVVLLQIKTFYLYGINVKFENINVE